MLENHAAFYYGRVVDTIVQNGDDVQLSSGLSTYRLMLLQIARDYAGLPDPRTLTVGQIAWWYDGLRPELKKYRQPRITVKGRHG